MTLSDDKGDKEIKGKGKWKRDRQRTVQCMRAKDHTRKEETLDEGAAQLLFLSSE
jgi:hypothetical protein